MGVQNSAAALCVSAERVSRQLFLTTWHCLLTLPPTTTADCSDDIS